VRRFSTAIASSVAAGLAIGLLVLGLFWTLTPAATPQTGDLPLNAQAIDAPPALSGDLVPYIGDGRGSISLVTVVDTRPGVVAGPGLEGGVATLLVLEAFGDAALNPGQRIDVPFQRMADPMLRPRNGFDHWNTISITPGAIWLFAGRKQGASFRVTALAAVPVGSRDSPAVDALRECFRIQGLSSTDVRKQELLVSALSGTDPLLRSYALDVLGRRGSYPRIEAAKLISHAIDSSTTPPADALELGEYLTRQYFFDGERSQDDTNEVVVQALASGLVRAKDVDTRSQWANYLASCILSELSPRKSDDERIRNTLVHSVKQPPPDEILGVLDSLEHQSDPDTVKRILELKNAWRVAH
jgi:hypothetical protein